MSRTDTFSHGSAKAVIVPTIGKFPQSQGRGFDHHPAQLAHRYETTRLSAINVLPLVQYISCDKRAAKTMRYNQYVYTLLMLPSCHRLRVFPKWKGHTKNSNRLENFSFYFCFFNNYEQLARAKRDHRIQGFRFLIIFGRRRHRDRTGRIHCEFRPYLPTFPDGTCLVPSNFASEALTTIRSTLFFSDLVAI